MEQLKSSNENSEDRKTMFERWKKELAEREKAFTHTKESAKRELEQLRQEIDRVSESAAVFLEEIYSSIEEKENLVNAEVAKPFEEADLDLIRSLSDALEKLYGTAQEMQDLITDNKGMGYAVEDKIAALGRDLKKDQKEGQ